MKKRILTIAAVLLGIALLCVCTLPVKTEIDLSLPGGRIDFDGSLLSGETAAISGCYRNYLLREDTLELNVDFPDLDTFTNYQNPVPWLRMDGYISQFQFIYVKDWGDVGSCNIYLANDGSWYLIRLNNRLFYGSAGGGPSPEEILAITRVTK